MNIGGLPKKNVFKRFLIKELTGGIATARLVEIADYEDFLNAPPAIMPEAEIQVRSTDQLKEMLSSNKNLRHVVAETVARVNNEGLTAEQADKLLLALSSTTLPISKRGLIQRFLDLFKNDRA